HSTDMNLRGQGTWTPKRRGMSECGYAMAALLVALNIMAVVLTVALPAWRTMVKREKEAELIWRGQQYSRAIGLFQRKYANTFPPNLDILLNERFGRTKYNEWAFVWQAASTRAGAPSGSQTPGMPGGTQKPGMPQPGGGKGPGTQPQPKGGGPFSNPGPGESPFSVPPRPPR